LESASKSLKGSISNIVHFLNKKTHGDFEPFLIENNICPECFSNLIKRSTDLGLVEAMETVCSCCGFVVPSYARTFFQKDERTWIGQHKPVNNLAYGKGLGGTLHLKGMWCVLAKGNGNKDLPLRARQISLITERSEHPKLMSLLKLGRGRMHEWGYDDHKNRANIFFSNYLGEILRNVGAFLIVRNLRFHLSAFADACFALCLKELKGEEEFKRAVETLEVPEDLLHQVKQIYELIK